MTTSCKVLGHSTRVATRGENRRGVYFVLVRSDPTTSRYYVDEDIHCTSNPLKRFPAHPLLQILSSRLYLLIPRDWKKKEPKSGSNNSLALLDTC